MEAPRGFAVLIAALMLAIGVPMYFASGCARSTPSELADVVFRRELAHVPAEFVPCLSVDGKDC